jgi:hypothetical protein
MPFYWCLIIFFPFFLSLFLFLRCRTYAWDEASRCGYSNFIKYWTCETAIVLSFEHINEFLISLLVVTIVTGLHIIDISEKEMRYIHYPSIYLSIYLSIILSCMHACIAHSLFPLLCKKISSYFSWCCIFFYFFFFYFYKCSAAKKREFHDISLREKKMREKMRNFKNFTSTRVYSIIINECMHSTLNSSVSNIEQEIYICLFDWPNADFI